MRTPLFAIALAVLASPAMARELPPGFVYLRDIDPSIVQDMRYAGIDNFTGAVLPGYGAGECVLRREIAQALRKVQADLAPQKLSLKTYDCYRPARASLAMARWAQSPEDGRTKRFYPALDKRTLFASGYIAAQSAHSTGTAIDLTIVRVPESKVAAYDPRTAYGPCTAAARAPDSSLDMGTGFDCFDGKTHTASGAITAEQKRNRGLLLAAMRAHGFKNYFREWWHFTFGSARGSPLYDVPVSPRAP